MKDDNKKLIIVLGMHRSGTSAITRGLKVLGVSLGDQLLEPVSGDNDKGYFEDTEVNAVNIELLELLGKDWHFLSSVSSDELVGNKAAHLRLRAIELIRNRLKDIDCFGIKDPRLCRLLPFWKGVFDYLKLDVSYVVAIRDPRSVAESLNKRADMPYEKSYYLWLAHVLPSILLTQEDRRVVVDYDLVINDPEKELLRIAKLLDLRKQLSQDELAEYCNGFIDTQLRHNERDFNDIFEDPLVPSSVKAAIKLLKNIASDEKSFISKSDQNSFILLSEQMLASEQAMNYLDRLGAELTRLSPLIVDKDRHVKNLEEIIQDRDMKLAERDVELLASDANLNDKDRHIVNLDKMIAQYEIQVEKVNQSLLDKDNHINNLDKHIVELEKQVAVHAHGNAERDEKIASLSKQIIDKDRHIVNLDRIILERQADMVSFGQEIIEKNEHIDKLEDQLSEKDNAIVSLEAHVAEKDNAIVSLEAHVAEKDNAIVSLEAHVAEKNNAIDLLDLQIAEKESFTAKLERQLEAVESDVLEKNEKLTDLVGKSREKDAELASMTSRLQVMNDDMAAKDKAVQHHAVMAKQYGYRLNKARDSFAWKLFKPVRLFKNVVARYMHGINVGLIPFSQIQADGSEWVSTGNDPQFLLVSERAWHGLSGWCWLELEAYSDTPLNAQLYFYIYDGFDPAKAIYFQLTGKGCQAIPLYVPYDCVAIRLDPCDVEMRFELTSLYLRNAKDSIELLGEFSGQAGVYKALEGMTEESLTLNPINDLISVDEDGYTWRSTGEDPWYLVEGFGLGFCPGWYSINLIVKSDIGYGSAKIYIDLGEGFVEYSSITMLYRSGRPVCRLVYLKELPNQIRLDPLDEVARFSVDSFKIEAVTAKAAHEEMLLRLCDAVPEYMNMSAKQVWRRIKKEAKSLKKSGADYLYQNYSESFPVADMTNTVTYTEWIRNVEGPEFSSIDAINLAQQGFIILPKISVVMPVYNTDEVYLRKAIDSVIMQSYPEWELCIADDLSTESHVRQVLDEYMEKDTRIKVVYREENGHISAASNSALSLATGDYVALLDHDDELSMHALYFVVQELNNNPSAQVVYSDEDKIDGEGNRVFPHFKSDWNPDLFLSQNYVSHLGVYDKKLLETIGGFRVGLEGSQDQDLLLRCLPHIKSEDIIHIPKILYHWRIVEGSTALGSGEKNYSSDAGIKAIEDSFIAQGRDDIKVELGLLPNTYRVRYPIPQPEPLVSLLVPTRDMLSMLEPCIRSILNNTSYQNYEIVIIDNESVEPQTLDFFEKIQAEDPRVSVLPYHHEFNYSAINNYGVQHARGEVIGLINNDVEVISQDWLSEMVSHALRPEIGCVGAKLYYDDETVQHAGVILGLGGVAGHSHKNYTRSSSGYFYRLKVVQNLSAVTAACLLVRKEVYDEVGGLEVDGLGVAFNDVDFCLKVRESGYRNIWTPYAELYHYESKSRGEEDTLEKIERFNKEMNFMKNKWDSVLTRDPYYSDNLTKAKEDFSLRRK